MIRYVVVWLTLALMSTSSFSQSRYPSRVLIQGDTVVCITIPQLHKANGLFVDRMEYKQIKDTLLSEVSIYKGMVSNYDLQIQVKDEIIGKMQQQIAYKDSSLTIAGDEIWRLQNKVDRQKKLIKLGGVGASLLIVLAAIF